MHIITGYTGENHITSADDASLHRAIFGEGDYVLDTGSKFKATIIDNNTIRIDDGDLLIQGHLARINPGDYEEVTIDNGTPGSMRYDLIVAKYLKDNVTGIESVTIEVIKGTAGATPTEPYITQDNLKNGGLERDFVLYRVLVDGATLDSVSTQYVTVGRENDLFVAKIGSLFEFTPLEANYGGAIYAMAADDAYVYVGGSGTPTVKKLNKSDLSQVATSASYGGDIEAIATDDEFVYVGGWITQTIRKLRKSDLSQVAESASYGGDIEAIATDDEFVYVGGTETQTVKKLNKSDLSQAATSTSYGGNIHAIATDDTYVYVGGATTQTIRKLRKSDLSQVAESADYGGDIEAIAADDEFVYVGGRGTQTVKKLNKSDLSQVAESADFGGSIYAMATDYEFIYVGGWGPQTIRAIENRDLIKIIRRYQ